MWQSNRWSEGAALQSMTRQRDCMPQAGLIHAPENSFGFDAIVQCVTLLVCAKYWEFNQLLLGLDQVYIPAVCCRLQWLRCLLRIKLRRFACPEVHNQAIQKAGQKSIWDVYLQSGALRELQATAQSTPSSRDVNRDSSR